MVTVRVFSKSSGKAIKGKKVSVSFDGLLRGMATEYTDSSGDAHFNVEPGSGKVYVDGTPSTRETLRDGLLCMFNAHLRYTIQNEPTP